jgi:hypothetical protein
MCDCHSLKLSSVLVGFILVVATVCPSCNKLSWISVAMARGRELVGMLSIIQYGALGY